MVGDSDKASMGRHARQCPTARRTSTGNSDAHGGTLKIDDHHEYLSEVCTSIIAEVESIVQGYFHIIPSGDKRVTLRVLLRRRMSPDADSRLGVGKEECFVLFVSMVY
jgi:hypothetical protein